MVALFCEPSLTAIAGRDGHDVRKACVELCEKSCAKSSPLGVRLRRRAADDAACELHEAAAHLAHGVLVGKRLDLLRQRLALAQVPPGYCAIDSARITFTFTSARSLISMNINDITVFINCSIITKARK